MNTPKTVIIVSTFFATTQLLILAGEKPIEPWTPDKFAQAFTELAKAEGKLPKLDHQEGKRFKELVSPSHLKAIDTMPGDSVSKALRAGSIMVQTGRIQQIYHKEVGNGTPEVAMLQEFNTRLAGIAAKHFRSHLKDPEPTAVGPSPEVIEKLLADLGKVGYGSVVILLDNSFSIEYRLLTSKGTIESAPHLFPNMERALKVDLEKSLHSAKKTGNIDLDKTIKRLSEILSQPSP